MASRPSQENIRVRRGPRHRIGVESPGSDTESVREFHAHTSGLSNRLPLPSCESMRAGTVLSPHGLVRRYLLSARSIGLSKEWALRFHVWTGRQINALWPMEQTSLHALEQRAMALEAADNSAEKCHDLKQDVESLRARVQTQQAELAADAMVLAGLSRRLEELEACK